MTTILMTMPWVPVASIAEVATTSTQCCAGWLIQLFASDATLKIAHFTGQQPEKLSTGLTNNTPAVVAVKLENV